VYVHVVGINSVSFVACNWKYICTYNFDLPGELIYSSFLLATGGIFSSDVFCADIYNNDYQPQHKGFKTTNARAVVYPDIVDVIGSRVEGPGKIKTRINF
jgi:hypothetical protein